MPQRPPKPDWLDRHPRIAGAIVSTLGLFLLAAVLFVYGDASAAEPQTAVTSQASQTSQTGGATVPTNTHGGAQAPQAEIRCLHRSSYELKRGPRRARLHADLTLKVHGGPVNPTLSIYVAQVKHGQLGEVRIPGTSLGSSIQFPSKGRLITGNSLDIRSRAFRRALAHRRLYLVVQTAVRYADDDHACSYRKVYKLRQG